mmetsp:Transcript_46073/g.147157  ORF Transcript_46073/g.147157 Transcript_46073/m.147157 type:complete len:210 (+) Transcript_46073:2479-3108(+)
MLPAACLKDQCQKVLKNLFELVIANCHTRSLCWKSCKELLAELVKLLRRELVDESPPLQLRGALLQRAEHAPGILLLRLLPAWPAGPPVLPPGLLGVLPLAPLTSPPPAPGDRRPPGRQAPLCLPRAGAVAGERRRLRPALAGGAALLSVRSAREPPPSALQPVRAPVACQQQAEDDQLDRDAVSEAQDGHRRQHRDRQHRQAHILQAQ